MYRKQYFIEKFGAIPDEKWTTGVFQTLEGECCAYGHCGARNTNVETGVPLLITEEAAALSQLIGRGDDSVFAANDSGRLGWAVVEINDGNGRRGRSTEGDTPKERILNALNNLKD